MLLDESAHVILVPEAEPMMKAFPDRHDRSAATGVPVRIRDPFRNQLTVPATRD